MKIKQKTIRNFVILSCIVLVLFLAGCFLKPAVTPSLPEQPTFTHYRVVTQAYKDSNPAHSIEIAWRANSIDYSFKIFKSLNGGSFEELFDDGVEQSSYYQRKSCSCSFTDVQVQPGNQYSYYVLAYNEKGEIGQTETFSREIFLPPCTLKEPQDNAVVDTPIPTFSWNNQELTKYLTKSRAEGYLKTHLKVNNETIQEEVWNMTFDDTTVDNVTYNLDSTGEPLENDNEYEWFHWTDAYDAEGNLIANAYSNSWHFVYKGPIKAVLMGKIMVPETSKSISKDVTGTIPLVGATITITDSEGNTHTGTTQAQGQYIFPQVAPGTNYIITATGTVDGQTVIYKDVVPSIELHEVFDAGVADAESTALALVMEAMLADDPNLVPEEIVLDDILTAGNFPALVTIVGETLNVYGNVILDPGVDAAVDAVDLTGIVLWLELHAQAWLDSNSDQIANMIAFPFVIKNYNWDTIGNYSESDYRSYLEEKFEVLTIETFYYQNNDIHLENQNTAVVYSDKHLKYTGQSGYTFDEINKIYFHLIKTETGWKADEYRVLCTVPMTRIAAELFEENGNYKIELYWRGYTYQDYEGIWQGADVSKYRIYRSVNGSDFAQITDANYEPVPGGNGNEFQFFDDTIVLGNDYAYYVTADGGDLEGESEPSLIASVIGSKIGGFEAMTFTENEYDEGIRERVLLRWLEYPSASEYIVWRKGPTDTDFVKVEGEVEFEDGEYEFWDETVTGGTTYEYYVEAVINGADNKQSRHIILDTWFDPVNISVPSPYQTFTETPTFNWDFSGIDFNSGSVKSAELKIWVAHRTTSHGWEEFWFMESDDLNSRSAAYGGDPLDNQEYHLEIFYEGYDENGNVVANSSGYQRFYYGCTLNGTARVMTFEDGNNQEYVKLVWNAHPDAVSYEVWKCLGISGNYENMSNEIEIIFDEEDNEYKVYDFDVLPGNTYQYYVNAKNNSGNLILTTNTLTFNRWLSPIHYISPPTPGCNTSIDASDLPITVAWTEPSSTSDINCIGVAIHDENEGIELYHDEINVGETSYTFPIDTNEFQDGQRYLIEVCYVGENHENVIATSMCGSWFYYGFQTLELEGQTWVEKHPDNSIEYAVRLYSDGYPNANTYHVYRYDGISENTADFAEISGVFELNPEDGSFEFWDLSITPGNTYSYYIIADLSTGGSSNPSRIITLDSWFSDFDLESPLPNAILTSENVPITFSWYPPTDINPGSITQGDVNISIRDLTIGERIWHCTIDDLTATSSEAYGDDLDEDGLLDGHEYQWRVTYDGEIETGEEIANTSTEGIFFYGSKPLKVRASTYTGMYGQRFVEIEWTSVGNNYDYQIFRSEDNGATFPFSSDDYEIHDNYFSNYFRDEEIIANNRYDYKIIAYDGVSGEIPSEVVTVDTWLPECESFTPVDGALITINSLQVFSWTFPSDFDFPYNGKVEFDRAWFGIHDKTSGQIVWQTNEHDNWKDGIIYDCSGLTPGNEYKWYYEICGIDTEWNNDVFDGFGGSFFYGSKPFIAEASSITGSFGDHQMEVRWPIYQGASDYKVFRSTNEGGYDMIFDSYGEIPAFYDNTIGWWIDQGVDFSFHTSNLNIFSFIDFTVTEGNSYSYYVVAYGENLQEEISSNKTITINTWLPTCWLVAPANGSIISDLNPLLEWSPPGISDFPFFQIYDGQMRLEVADLTVNEEVWDVDFYDLTTSSIIYDGDPLVAEHSYIWRWYPMGFDQDGHFIAEAIGGTYQFIYDGQ